MATFPKPASLVTISATVLEVRREGVVAATLEHSGSPYIVTIPGRQWSRHLTLGAAFKAACGLTPSMSVDGFYKAMHARGYFRPGLNLWVDAWGRREVSAFSHGIAGHSGFPGENPATWEEGIATAFAQLTKGGARYEEVYGCA